MYLSLFSSKNNCRSSSFVSILSLKSVPLKETYSIRISSLSKPNCSLISKGVNLAKRERWVSTFPARRSVRMEFSKEVGVIPELERMFLYCSTLKMSFVRKASIFSTACWISRLLTIIPISLAPWRKRVR